MFEFIQCRIFDIGSSVATPRSSDPEKLIKVQFPESSVKIIENWIDQLDSSLPKLTNFILPSGGELAARVHVARAVCRRAERSLARNLRAGEIEEPVFAFMNRLSDFLFVAARTATIRGGGSETIWKKEVNK